MRKISFVVTNTDFEKLDKFKKDVLKIFEKKYDYEFIFVSTMEDEEKHQNSKHCKFVVCDSSLNKQIKRGFELTDDKSSCIILCDMSSGDYIEYISKLIENWEKGAKIVRLKQVKNKSSFFEKIGHFFQKVVRSVNNFVCKLVGYKSKIFCYNSYQLFDKEVFRLIKSIPEKNTYFRNHEVLTNFETAEIITSEKLAFKNNKMQWTKKSITSLVLFVSFAVVLLTFALVYPVAVKEKFSNNFVAIMMFLCIGLLIFSSYYYFSALLDFQLDRE